MENTINNLKQKLNNTATKPLDGSNPDSTTYSRWSHVFDASTNALQTTEELVFFVIIIIIFFVLAFLALFNIGNLIRVLKNLDGSLYQTKHIVTKIIFIAGCIFLDYHLFLYILEAAKII